MARYFPSEAKPSGLDLFTLLQKRRSIREFKTDDVPYYKIEAIMAAGNHAPSGGNRHSWHYVVVSDPKQKRLIREDCEKGDEHWHNEAEEKLQKWLKAKHIDPVKPFLTDAPYLIVVFGDTRDPYWLESTWISIGYMMIAAVDQGLGTVIYTPGETNFLNEFLDVADHFSPQVVLPIGVPQIEPQPNPKQQTEKEHLYRLSKQEPQSDVVSDSSLPNDHQDNGKPRAEKPQNVKCACGCGKTLIGINPKRKYIHGHSKFGENGLLEILKSPPKCKCGCDETTEWNWERMTWKKYIDSHIGVRNSKGRAKSFPKKQIDLFKQEV